MKTVIEMAREVKLPYDYVTGEPINLEKLEAFSELARADEREACAKVLDEMAEDMEREMEPSTAIAYVRSKAATIRARGETKCKLKSLTFDEYKVAAKATLNEAADEEPDAVIVLMFHRGTGQFKIKCSKVENRLELVGALEEAKNHVLVTGYAS